MSKLPQAGIKWEEDGTVSWGAQRLDEASERAEEKWELVELRESKAPGDLEAGLRHATSPAGGEERTEERTCAGQRRCGWGRGGAGGQQAEGESGQRGLSLQCGLLL